MQEYFVLIMKFVDNNSVVVWEIKLTSI